MSKNILALDSSQITSWLSCPRKWHLGYEENLAPVEENRAFSKGSLVHKLLEIYYQQRKLGNLDSSITTAIATTRRWLEENPHESITGEEWSEITRRFLAYASFYNDRFQVIDTEVGFSVPILETAESFFVLEGRVDLVMSSDVLIYWMDHKSLSRDSTFQIGPSSGKERGHYKFNPQALDYCLALGTRYGMYNYFGLQKSGDQSTWFHRKLISFNQQQLNEWKFELINIFYEITYAKKRGIYRKNRVSCKNGLNRPCDFCHICEQTSPEFANEIKRTEFKTREPWTPWEIGEAENGV